MQNVGRRYVRYVNNAYERTGTLWEGHFKSAIVSRDEYLVTCTLFDVADKQASESGNGNRLMTSTSSGGPVSLHSALITGGIRIVLQVECASEFCH